MNEVLSRAEIEAQCPNEWILMVDPDPGWNVNFRGLVVAHSTNQDELYEKSKAYRPREIVVFFAGPPFPPGMARLGLTPRNYQPVDPIARAALLKEVQRIKTIHGFPSGGLSCPG